MTFWTFLDAHATGLGALVALTLFLAYLGWVLR